MNKEEKSVYNKWYCKKWRKEHPNYSRYKIEHTKNWCIDCGKRLSSMDCLRCDACKVTGKLNYGWKGEKAGYQAKHIWIKKHYGKASKCEDINCNRKSKTYQWANISGKYIRNRKDYKQLCVSCHRNFDIKRETLEKMKLKRKEARQHENNK